MEWEWKESHDGVTNRVGGATNFLQLVIVFPSVSRGSLVQSSSVASRSETAKDVECENNGRK